MTNIENEHQGGTARSPVIDLEAEDISPVTETASTESPAGETEAPKQDEPKEEVVQQEETSPPPSKSERQPFWTKGRIAGAAAVIAAIVGIWAYREIGSQWWPPSTMAEKLATLEASNRTFNEQLVALSGNLDNFKAAAERQAAEQVQKASALESKLAELEKSLGDLKQTVAGLSPGAGGEADPAALAEVTKRIEKLEQDVAALQSKGPPPPTTTGNENFGQLAQALAGLQAKFQAGLPFADELDRIAVYVPDNADLAALRPFAASGLINATGLGAALEGLIPSLAGPGSQEADAGEASGFWAWVGTVVKVRDLNTLDWADLARAAAADAKAGDLKAAIARLDEPGGDLPATLADWRDKARQRLKAETAVAQLTAAVTQIIAGKP